MLGICCNFPISDSIFRTISACGWFSNCAEVHSTFRQTRPASFQGGHFDVVQRTGQAWRVPPWLEAPWNTWSEDWSMVRNLQKDLKDRGQCLQEGYEYYIILPSLPPNSILLGSTVPNLNAFKTLTHQRTVWDAFFPARNPLWHTDGIGLQHFLGLGPPSLCAEKFTHLGLHTSYIRMNYPYMYIYIYLFPLVELPYITLMFFHSYIRVSIVMGIPQEMDSSKEHPNGWSLGVPSDFFSELFFRKWGAHSPFVPSGHCPLHSPCLIGVCHRTMGWATKYPN